LSLLDVPNERSHHCKVIPRGAGIGFVIAIFSGMMIDDFAMVSEYWYVFLSILIVFSVGVLDDIYDTPPKAKFLVIFIAVALLWWYGLSIDSFGSWFGVDIKLWWFALPFTMFALAGFTNALNLIDGLDGLAGLISVVIIGVFGYIGYIHKDMLMVELSLFSIASLLGFLILNYNPAKVFMGDSGSLSLGFIISVLAVMSIKYIHPVVILYIAAIPILDTLVVMIRRIKMGISPFSPDKTHLHHILVRFIGDEARKVKVISATRGAVWFLVVVQCVFSCIGLMVDRYITLHTTIVPPLALLGFGAIFVMVYKISYVLYKSK
jgi:UDP-GlcNAc:undecaprenyl-phosphate GlcNAc-1-phosphate transferase